MNKILMWVLVSVLSVVCIACGNQQSEGEISKLSAYDKQVIEAYEKAQTMAGWFRIGTVDYDVNDVIEQDGNYYNRVKDYPTMDALLQKLYESFTEEYAKNLVESGIKYGIEYREIDKVLYASGADRGTDSQAGKETYSVAGDEKGGILTVTVEVLSEDGTGKVEGYIDYEFPYVVESETILFTDFPQVR